MKIIKSRAGVTILEMMAVVVIISLLATIYFFMVESYKDRRMSEQAAKVLVQAARAQEEFFAAEHRYFDAEVSGNGGNVYLTAPGGAKTSVHVPASVTLTLKAQGKDKREFMGYAFYSGSKVVHRYDSKTGKITTSQRVRDEAG